ncbi:class F sortase [Streptomyces sp. NPDC020801]|uniref:class F sortase n=1 Tax=unclassified Streptomyces TaxID=2593676 RepID=UPI0037B6FAC3
MVPRRRRRRPWHRTRAYRLARTTVLAVVLVTAGVRCGGQHERTTPDHAAGPGAVAPASPASSGSSNYSDADADADADGDTDGDTDSAKKSGSHGRKSPSPGRPASSAPPPAPLPRSRATSLRIPSLGIDAPVIGVRLDRDRQLETPPVDKPKLVGWYEGGPTPGETGTAVAVGHRDTTTGPAVFAGLGQTKPGSHVEVRRADGRTAVYTVDKVRVFDKSHFPDKEVYGPVHRPELRVITCGGLYSHSVGYSSNVVVFAHLTSTT